MRAVFDNVRAPRSKKWVQEQVAIRVHRQQRLHGAEPLQYHAIITEFALRHADRQQLLHVNEIAELSNVTVQVILDSVGLHEGHNGSFTLLDFPYPSSPPRGSRGWLPRGRGEVFAVWRKSSRSGSGGNADCVEVALNGSTALVRDSENQAATIAVPGWAAFLDAVTRGDLRQI